MSSNIVMLEYTSNAFHVSLEGYEAIKRLIAQHQICKTCQSPIDDDTHRLVGRNLCLACVLVKHPTYTFAGQTGRDIYGNGVFAFTDAHGVMHTSTANSSDEPRKDIYLSLQLAGFPVPETYVLKGDKDNPVQLGHYNWSTYGNLDGSVIVLEYSSSYPTVKAVFLSYKGGSYVELSKRTLAFKQTFERARAMLERTAHMQFGSVYYTHPDGYEISHISDSTLYPLIAQLEAAVWDIQRRFTPPVTLVTEAMPELEPVQDAEEEAPASQENGERDQVSPHVAQPKRRGATLRLVPPSAKGDEDEPEPQPEEREHEQSEATPDE